MDDKPTLDQFVTMLADMDQAVATWGTLVPGLYRIYRSSVEAGFDEEQAMMLLFGTFLKPSS